MKDNYSSMTWLSSLVVSAIARNICAKPERSRVRIPKNLMFVVC